MGIAKWFGLGQEIASPIDAVGRAVDSIFTSDEERLDRQAVLEGIRNSPYMAAMQIAMVEAGSSDRWTSRARPMLIYAFCLVFVTDRAAMPVLWWLLQVFRDVAIPPPPSLLSSGHDHDRGRRRARHVLDCRPLGREDHREKRDETCLRPLRELPPSWRLPVVLAPLPAL